MPDSVIDRIGYWGEKDQRERGRLPFHNRNNEPFDWTDDDEPLVADNAVEPVITPAPFPDIPAEMPGVPLERDMPTPAVETIEPTWAERAAAARRNANIAPNLIPAGTADDDRSDIRNRNIHNNFVYNLNLRDNNNNGDNNADEPPQLVRDEDSSDDEDENYEPSDQEDEPLSLEDEASDHRSASDDRSASNDENDSDHRSGEETTTRTGRVVRPTRSNWLSDFQMLQATGRFKDADALEEEIGKASLEQETVVDGEETIFGHIMVQLSLKQALKKWGERSAAGAKKEMQQMHDMNAFFSRDVNTLTKEQRVRALSSLIFLKEKHTGEIKGRICVNGAPQRKYIRKEDAASPTVATDSTMMTGAINAHEKRDVATLDIPGAFLNTLTDELIIMVLKGKLCELMCQVDPKVYRRYVTKDRKGTPILYVQLYKSVYGLLRSALLFYRKLRGELEDYGFTVNPYDPCVANRIADDGNQQTVIWHVNDLKVSHVDAFENTKFIHYLRKIYGPKMTVTRGKQHRYLGMDFDYSTPKVCRILMAKYIEGILEDFPELINKSAKTPHTENLFKVRDASETKHLDEDMARMFHHAVAQLLFLSCRARRDIQTAVAFLTTRVKRPDEDDWGKVKRVLQYLYGTKHMPLNLTVDNLQSTKWFIDSAHGVHIDCKGHSGGGMTLGQGAVMSGSRKQKINSRSSTETEVIGVDDFMPNVLWSLYFLQEQGYGTEHAVIYQDNKSAILLETNGRMSQSKRTKHIKMKYFFVKDKVDSGEVVIKHMPGEELWADVLSKPSTGKRFFVDRSKLQNVAVHWVDESLEPATDTPPMTITSPQECVEKRDSATKNILRQDATQDEANLARRKVNDACNTRRVTWKGAEPQIKLTFREAMALSKRIKRDRRRGMTQRTVAVAE
eukprot:scaffold248363_cov77-Cyclotella_meneghiniana.AAC.2